VFVGFLPGVSNGTGNRMRRWSVEVFVGRLLGSLACAVAVVVVGGCAPGTHASRPVATRTGTSTSSATDTPQRAEVSWPCVMPNLPAAGSGVGLSGPAVTALTGGAATTAITLDNDSFDLAPPPPGSQPKIAKDTIICEALASEEMDGAQFGGDAPRGMAVGYGLVTVSPMVRLSNLLLGESATPKVPVYDHRLAWVVVVAHQETSSCPGVAVPYGSTPSSSAPTTIARPVTWGYSVFLADAATGSDTLVYTEAFPALCGGVGLDGPYQSIPIETISVPWTLLSRDPDGYAGRIRALVPPCWTAPSPVDVVRGSNMVQVLAGGIAGQTCGQARPVSLILDADTVFDVLPSHLVPAPLGPAISSAPLPSSPVAATTGQLITLTPQQNGTTLTVHIGDVLVAQPPLIALPGEGSQAGVVIRSSNTAILSQLSQGTFSLPEFRAWQTGRAVVSDQTGWSVTVIVTRT
jgi:hypothetical protein